MTFRWKGQANEMEDEIMQVLLVYQLWRKNPLPTAISANLKNVSKIIIAGCFGCWILDWQAGRGRGQARASCHCLISVVVHQQYCNIIQFFKKREKKSE